jgi:restriction system protein
LAAASYAGLHYAATGIVATPTAKNAIGGAIVRQLGKTAAGFGQYIVPIPFLVGAVVSVMGRRKRDALHRRAAGAEGLSAIATMSWREFEMLIGEAFRRRGFRVAERGGQGADGGVDVMLTKDGERHLVQCKHWRATRVPVAIVRELYGVMAAQGAASGFVVTAGEFTKDAHDFAKGRNLELIDGAALAAMLRKTCETLPATPAAAFPSEIAASDAGHGIAPRCPKCGKPMVKRIARQGADVGKAFWGCSGFPGCRGVRSA